MKELETGLKTSVSQTKMCDSCSVGIQENCDALIKKKKCLDKNILKRSFKELLHTRPDSCAMCVIPLLNQKPTRLLKPHSEANHRTFYIRFKH